MSTKTKAVKPVYAWANVTKRGRLDGGLVSSIRMLLASRGRSSSRFLAKPVRVLITPVK